LSIAFSNPSGDIILINELKRKLRINGFWKMYIPSLFSEVLIKMPQLVLSMIGSIDILYSTCTDYDDQQTCSLWHTQSRNQ
jgi:hypothetical protein